MKKPKAKYGKFTESKEDGIRLLFIETRGDIKQISKNWTKLKSQSK